MRAIPLVAKRHPVYGAILVSLDDILTVQREIKSGETGKACMTKSNGTSSTARAEIGEFVELQRKANRLLALIAAKLDRTQN